MPIPVDMQYRQNASGVHSRTIAAVTVLHRESWVEPLVLNREFQMVWTCLEIGGSVEEITADITSMVSSPPGRIRADVIGAFRALAELDLIEPVGVLWRSRALGYLSP